MLVFKITLDITGDNLYPDELIHKLSDELIMLPNRGFKPTDTLKYRGNGEQYGFGCMYLMHPKRICPAGKELVEYEKTIIQFLEKNYQIIRENGGTDLTVSYNVYSSNDTYTIGLFDRDLLKVITRCNADISFCHTYKSEEKLLAGLQSIESGQSRVEP